MIGVYVYAAPVPGGVALVVPPAALADLRAVAALLARHPGGARMDVLVGEPLDQEALTAQATLLVRRAAAAAALSGSAGEVGPRGRWYAGLLVWGWLLILTAAQHWAQVLGGLWLAAGLPLARRAYRRGQRAAPAVVAEALSAVAEPAAVRQVEHAGLARLAAAVREAREQPSEAYRAAGRLCAPTGLADLAPFYQALAAGDVPPAIWSALSGAPPAAVPAAAAAPAAAPAVAPAATEAPATETVLAGPLAGPGAKATLAAAPATGAEPAAAAPAGQRAPATAAEATLAGTPGGEPATASPAPAEQSAAAAETGRAQPAEGETPRTSSTRASTPSA